MVVELVAQPADVDVDRTGAGVHVAPDPLEELRAAEHLARVLGEEEQQVVLQPAQIQHRTVAEGGPRLRVQVDHAGLGAAGQPPPGAPGEPTATTGSPPTASTRSRRAARIRSRPSWSAAVDADRHGQRPSGGARPAPRGPGGGARVSRTARALGDPRGRGLLRWPRASGMGRRRERAAARGGAEVAAGSAIVGADMIPPVGASRPPDLGAGLNNSSPMCGIGFATRRCARGSVRKGGPLRVPKRGTWQVRSSADTGRLRTEEDRWQGGWSVAHAAACAHRCDFGTVRQSMSAIWECCEMRHRPPPEWRRAARAG